MTQRLYYLDAVRAFCLFFGIFFHASLIYSPQLDWIINAAERSPWLVLPGAASQAFRMVTFFVISGFFSALLLTRRPVGEWLATRVMRILLPMVTTGILLNTSSVWLHKLCHDGRCDFSSGAIAGMAPVELRALLQHMWFLETLLILILLTAVAYQLSTKPRIAAMARRFGRFAMGGSETVLRPFLITFAALLLTQGVLAKGQSETLETVMVFLPYFALGAALALSPQLLARYRRLTPAAVIFGAGFLLLAMAAYAFDAPSGQRKLAQALSGLCFSRLLIALAYRHLDRPHPFLRRAADLSFSVYLIHQPLIVILGVAFFAVDLSPVTEFLLISALTLVISWQGAVLIDRSAVARLLFNGKWHDAWSRKAPAQAAAGQG